jgi:hypothetical protein
MFPISILAIFYLFSSVTAASLETVNDEDLLNLIKTEKYVVTLFSKCPDSGILSCFKTNLEDQ